ncbi:hypothetical protein P3T24_006366 [Paraburkholderia sp. GAS33]|jgi:hypothetical protein|uniref:hypothetical protein n=1 Tax=Paraburkholderia sp. GAS33 TaxID=3035130 RepID=UPI003D20CE94
MFANLTLMNLSNCYSHAKPGAGVEDFVYEILNVIAIKDHPGIEEPIEIVMQFASEQDKAKGPDWIAKSPYGPLIVSCAYCVRALSAIRGQDVGLGWSYMADARYWCGVAISSKGIDEARERTIIQTHREKGAAGGAGKGKAYEPIRQHAYKLVRDMRPPIKGWQSKAHAVNTIRQPVLDFSAANKLKDRKAVTLSESNAQKKLEEWLSKMPDAGDLFPPSKRNKASKKKPASKHPRDELVSLYDGRRPAFELAAESLEISFDARSSDSP